MRLIWTPPGGERREFDFQPLQIQSVEAEAIEDVGGRRWETYDEFGRLFMAGNRKAMRAALWIVRRREEPRLRFDDLTLRVDELHVDFDDAETARLRAQIEQDDDLDAEQREYLLEQLGDDPADGGAEVGEPDPTVPPSGSPPESPATDSSGAATGG